jgi:heme-degrading monooxygenase HmoA
MAEGVVGRAHIAAKSPSHHVRIVSLIIGNCGRQYSRQGAAEPREGSLMAIVRLIFVTVDPQDGAAAERLWKEECAPLMIKQRGCLSEELMKSVDTPGEYISYSVWESQESIDRYRESEAHQEIKQHGARLKSTCPPRVREYVLV